MQIRSMAGPVQRVSRVPCHYKILQNKAGTDRPIDTAHFDVLQLLLISNLIELQRSIDFKHLCGVRLLYFDELTPVLSADVPAELV
jgi:hypothetical protein